MRFDDLSVAQLETLVEKNKTEISGIKYQINHSRHYLTKKGMDWTSRAHHVITLKQARIKLMQGRIEELKEARRQRERARRDQINTASMDHSKRLRKLILFREIARANYLSERECQEIFLEVERRLLMETVDS